MMKYVIVGAISGIISGLGIGGGTILIPTLTFLGVNQQTAQAINLIYFIPTAAIAVYIHKRNNNIEKRFVYKILLPALIFAAIGSIIASKIKTDILRKLFGCFLIIVGAMEIFKRKK